MKSILNTFASKEELTGNLVVVAGEEHGRDFLESVEGLLDYWDRNTYP